MRLTALAVVLGRFVALAQSQPETVSGVFQVVVVEDLGKTALHPRNPCNTAC
jgi:hypothetical protein